VKTNFSYLTLDLRKGSCLILNSRNETVNTRFITGFGMKEETVVYI